MVGIIRKKDLSNWDLFETYRININSPWMNENKLGTWNKLKGLEMTNLSMYERKADFFGMSMKGYFKAPVKLSDHYNQQ